MIDPIDKARGDSPRLSGREMVRIALGITAAEGVAAVVVLLAAATHHRAPSVRVALDRSREAPPVFIAAGKLPSPQAEPVMAEKPQPQIQPQIQTIARSEPPALSLLPSAPAVDPSTLAGPSRRVRPMPTVDDGRAQRDPPAGPGAPGSILVAVEPGAEASHPAPLPLPPDRDRPDQRDSTPLVALEPRSRPAGDVEPVAQSVFDSGQRLADPPSQPQSIVALSLGSVTAPVSVLPRPELSLSGGGDTPDRLVMLPPTLDTTRDPGPAIPLVTSMLSVGFSAESAESAILPRPISAVYLVPADRDLTGDEGSLAGRQLSRLDGIRPPEPPSGADAEEAMLLVSLTPSWDVAETGAEEAPKLAIPPVVTAFGGRSISAATSTELAEVFDNLDFTLGEGRALPAVFVDRLPKDLGKLSAHETRKALFLRALLPAIAKINEENLSRRRYLLGLLSVSRAGDSLTQADHQFITRLSDEFKLARFDLEELLRRCDVIPPSLAIAQAAEESGWGTAKPAHDINSLFGQMAFDVHSGPDGTRVVARLARFETLTAAVAAYIQNLNTHPNYAHFRLERAKLRAAGRFPDGHTLAPFILSYSERGPAYVQTLRTLIRWNNLTDFDQLHLAGSPARQLE